MTVGLYSKKRPDVIASSEAQTIEQCRRRALQMVRGVVTLEELNNGELRVVGEWIAGRGTFRGVAPAGDHNNFAAWGEVPAKRRAGTKKGGRDRFHIQQHCLVA
jgi:hypothetical protein